MSKMQLEDKKLYSYKQALNQPYWIQKFNDEFALSSPIKFSRIVYFALIFGLLYFLFELLLVFLPYGLRIVIGCMIAWYLSEILSNLVIDGKAIVFYLYDYFRFYLKYGRQSNQIYLNKGVIYTKLKPMKSERRLNEI